MISFEVKGVNATVLWCKQTLQKATCAPDVSAAGLVHVRRVWGGWGAEQADALRATSTYVLHKRLHPVLSVSGAAP